MYYYRPQRSSTSTRPTPALNRIRQELARKPAPETHEPFGMPEGTPDRQAQATPVLDTQTMLLLLLLIDRLAREKDGPALSSIETEGPIVESERPAIEEEVQDVLHSPRFSRTHRFPLVLLALCALACMMVIAVSLLPLATASATVTIIPVQREITARTTLTAVTTGPANAAQQQVQGRRLPSLTLSQAQTVPTTGRGSQQATHAHGVLTFYNALPQAQSISAGTLIPSADGIQIVTDQDAVIPPGTGAINGQVSVSAHAVQVGLQGNIAVGAITGTCCRAYVLVTNHLAFGGGQNARTFPIVVPQDINGAATALKTSLTQSVQAALQAQVRPDETLIKPVPCTPRITPTHAAGEEATHLTVTMEEVCTGETYNTQALQAQVMQVVTQEATTQLGTEYSLTGEVQVTVTPSSNAVQKDGTITLQVRGIGTWAYQFDDAHLQRIAQLITSKSREQATRLLLRLPGVSQACVNVSGTSSTSLPADTGRIHVLVLFRSA